MRRHPFVAEREASLLLIIDVQEAMRKVMGSWEATVAKVRQLGRAAHALGVPVLVTEQYKKGLGPTDPELLREIQTSRVFQKEHFSACLEPAFLPAVQDFQRRQIVVAGMETHVCVLQTALDLIASGFQVHLVADAVASRVEQNRETAVDLLRQAGAVVSSAEIVIFQWARRANTTEFRRILPIVK
jgi:nicotinamidase-related amidase